MIVFVVLELGLWILFEVEPLDTHIQNDLFLKNFTFLQTKQNLFIISEVREIVERK